MDGIFVERPPRRKTMPELPDIVVYIERREARIAGQTLVGVRLADRARSRLLKSDWPRNLEEMEA